MHARIPSAVALTLAAIAAVAAPLDLNNLPNYANQPRPAYITRDNTTPGNPITDKGATLGRVLFYDKKLSRNDTVSCSTCHQQANAFADMDLASEGVNGFTGRHSMRLINARFGQDPKMFWDERAATVEAQVTQPIQDHAEMGFSGTNGDPSFADLVTKMNGISYYPHLFTEVFGDPTITEDRMQRALAQFVRSIQSFDSKYDTGRAAAGNNNANFPNFTVSENAGKNIFNQPPVFNGAGQRTAGGAGCAGCHRPPEFDIDPNSLSNGVIGVIAGGQDLTNRRSPSLRDSVTAAGVARGPFMHDGSLPTMTSVIAHYNAIPNTVLQPGIRPSIDNRIVPGGNPQQLQLTPQEIADILAFMNTLAGVAVTTDARWSTPFEADGTTLLIEGFNTSVAGWMVF